jgi:hypothetical protein
VEIGHPVAAKEGGRRGVSREKGDESARGQMVEEVEGDLELKLCGQA